MNQLIEAICFVFIIVTISLCRRVGICWSIAIAYAIAIGLFVLSITIIAIGGDN